MKLLFSFRGVDEVEVPEDRIVVKCAHHMQEKRRFERRCTELLYRFERLA